MPTRDVQGSGRIGMLRGSLVLAGIACLVLLVLLVRGERSHAASSKPNVIMFTTDDQTVRDLVAMPKTQGLIGAQGANFLHAYVSMSLCCPSRITVQTGEYAHNHHVMGNTPPQGGYGVFNDKNDLPVWLQQAGYRTIHIGKMPNGFGTETNETYVPPGWGPYNNGLGRGEFYAFIKPASSYTDFALDENGALKQYGPEDYQTNVYADLAVDRIDQHFTVHANDPLYMQVQFFAPHDPATPATKYQNAFAASPLPIDPSFNEKNVKDKPGWIRAISRFGPGLIAKIQTRYQHRLETLLSVDDAIERIVNQLSASGQLDNTYLIFTSDNGFMQGQHRLHQGKFAPYEPSIQVPLLIRGPGIPAGSQPRALVWNGDITSTILQIAGAQPGLPQDGRSLLPYATDPNLPSTRPILIETGPPGATERARDPGERRERQAPRPLQHLRQEPRPGPHRPDRPRHRRPALSGDPDRALPAGQVLGRQPRALRPEARSARVEEQVQGLPLLPGPQVPAEEAEGAGALPGRGLQPRHQEAAEAARQEEETRQKKPAPTAPAPTG